MFPESGGSDLDLSDAVRLVTLVCAMFPHSGSVGADKLAVSTLVSQPLVNTVNVGLHVLKISFDVNGPRKSNLPYFQLI